MGIGLDAWWNEPAYKTCNTFHLRGLFIFALASSPSGSSSDGRLATSCDSSESASGGRTVHASRLAYFSTTRRLGRTTKLSMFIAAVFRYSRP
jgi:hypothetical protein